MISLEMYFLSVLDEYTQHWDAVAIDDAVCYELNSKGCVCVE